MPTHPIHTGDIFSSSWGYDQTNVDFYEVVGTTPKGVKVQQIGAHYVEDHGPGGARVVPNREHRIGEVMTKRLKCYTYNGERWAFYVASYADAYQWDGKPEYCTSYGWGH